MATCSSCSAPIDWIRTRLGKAMPLDPEYVEVAPDQLGETVVVTDAGEVVRGLRVHDPGTTVRGRVSHFATCPQAAAYRRGR